MLINQHNIITTHGITKSRSFVKKNARFRQTCLKKVFIFVLYQKDDILLVLPRKLLFRVTSDFITYFFSPIKLPNHIETGGCYDIEHTVIYSQLVNYYQKKGNMRQNFVIRSLVPLAFFSQTKLFEYMQFLCVFQSDRIIWIHAIIVMFVVHSNLIAHYCVLLVCKGLYTYLREDTSYSFYKQHF